MIDLKEIRRTIIKSIRKSPVGDKLSKTTGKGGGEIPIILKARPNPPYPIQKHPYCVIDITRIGDVEQSITNAYYSDDEDIDGFIYETHKELEVMISFFGKDSQTLAQELKTSYRRFDIRGELTKGGVSLISVEDVNLQPELQHTDFLESSFIIMNIRTVDVFVDKNMGRIDKVEGEGILKEADSIKITFPFNSYPI